VREIADEGLEAGDSLPPESDMVQRFGVGRASVREALRILEAHGLIYLKTGRKGGPVVAQTGPDQLGSTLSLFFGLSGATYGDLADFMVTVSPLLAERAAHNPDRDMVRTLLSTVAGNPCALHAQHEYGPHSAINKLAGNPLLAMFADAVDAVFSGHVFGITKQRDFKDEAIASHEAIAEAVLDGRAADARELMGQHIRDIVAYAERKIPGISTSPVEWK
jgi:DNA-binding FadR family transcriptional regulator